MDGFSKFGVGLICMLAMVLLAVTPDTASSHSAAVASSNSATISAPAIR